MHSSYGLQGSWQAPVYLPGSYRGHQPKAVPGSSRPAPTIETVHLFLPRTPVSALFQNLPCRVQTNPHLLLPTCEHGDSNPKVLPLHPDNSERNLQVTMESDKAKEVGSINAQRSGLAPPTSETECVRLTSLSQRLCLVLMGKVFNFTSSL